MKSIRILSVLLLTLLISSAWAMGQGNNEKKVPYPNIIITMADGVLENISGKIWAGTIIPFVQGRVSKLFHWGERIKYLFFDKSLKGLNPYGVDFIRAMEESTSKEIEKNVYIVISKALNATANLDSDGDGYTNMKEIESGTYPGFADSYPGKNAKNETNNYIGYATIAAIMGATFVLYFIFNREKKKS